MDALRLRRSLHSEQHTNIHSKKPTSRRRLLVSCRSRGGKKGEEEEETNHGKRAWRLIAELKNTMSPKHKGDWKDVALMSLSFAVYVYISQRIVSAYCAWVSILKH